VIPLHDSIPTGRRPVVVLTLIAINVAVFLFELAAPTRLMPTTDGHAYKVEGQTAVTAEYGFVPCEVEHRCPIGNDRIDLGATAPFEVPHRPLLVTVFTSMFLHGGWAHLLFNMLFLWIFGNNVEDRLGRLRFLAFYLLGGAAALALQFIADPTSDLPTIGASGAIAAVLGGYLVLFPRAVVITLIGWIPVPLPAMLFLLIWIGLQALGAAAGLSIVGGGAGDNVAYFAHLGGFVFGLATVRWFARAGRPGPASA
jgi:membrane associated rhomboid family serine protease